VPQEAEPTSLALLNETIRREQRADQLEIENARFRGALEAIFDIRGAANDNLEFRMRRIAGYALGKEAP